MSKKINAQNADIVNKLDEDIFVALLRKGAFEYLEDSLSDKDSDSNDLLPEASEKRIMNLIRKQIRKEKTSRFIRRLPKIAAIIFIVIAVCTITIVSVKAFRIPVFNLFIKTKEEITDIKIDNEEATNLEANTQISEPSYIPEGYELTKTDTLGESLISFYSNTEGNLIIISQYAINSELAVDTENAEYGSLDINGYEGFYAIKNGSVQLIFKTDEYAYLIQAAIDISETIKIAESIY